MDCMPCETCDYCQACCKAPAGCTCGSPGLPSAAQRTARSQVGREQGRQRMHEHQAAITLLSGSEGGRPMGPTHITLVQQLPVEGLGWGAQHSLHVVAHQQGDQADACHQHCWAITVQAQGAGQLRQLAAGGSYPSQACLHPESTNQVMSGRPDASSSNSQAASSRAVVSKGWGISWNMSECCTARCQSGAVLAFRLACHGVARTPNCNGR